MKIFTMIRVDMNTGETLEEDSYEYDGPLALAIGPCSSNSSYGPGSYSSNSDDLSSLPQPNPGDSGSDIFSNLDNSNPQDESNPEDISSLHSLFSSSADNSNNTVKTENDGTTTADISLEAEGNGWKAELKGEIKAKQVNRNDGSDSKDTEINKKATLRAEMGKTHAEVTGSQEQDKKAEGGAKIGIDANLGNDKAKISSAEGGVTKTDGEPEETQLKLKGKVLGTKNEIEIKHSEEKDTIKNQTTVGPVTITGEHESRTDGHKSTVGAKVDISKGLSAEGSYSKDSKDGETYKGKLEQKINDDFSIVGEAEKNEKDSKVSAGITFKW